MSTQTHKARNFMKKYEVNGVEIEEVEDDSTIVIYHGSRLLLKSNTLMSVDEMDKKYGAVEMLYLPEYGYELIVWLWRHGYTNKHFKFVSALPKCWYCREHYHKQIPACYVVSTRSGAQPVCPEHSMNHQVIHILLERSQ